jgi:hypothetical protein
MKESSWKAQASLSFIGVVKRTLNEAKGGRETERKFRGCI